MATVEVRPSARRVAAKRLSRLTADRNDPLLAALADDAHEAVVQVDRGTLEADGLRHAQARAVQQLDEGAVAQRPRRDTGGGVDQPLGLAGRKRLRQPTRAAGERDGCGRIVLTLAEQLKVAVERPGRGDAARYGRRRKARRPEARNVPLEILGGPVRE